MKAGHIYNSMSFIFMFCAPMLQMHPSGLVLSHPSISFHTSHIIYTGSTLPFVNTFPRNSTKTKKHFYISSILRYVKGSLCFNPSNAMEIDYKFFQLMIILSFVLGIDPEYDSKPLYRGSERMLINPETYLSTHLLGNSIYLFESVQLESTTLI